MLITVPPSTGQPGRVRCDGALSIGAQSIGAGEAALGVLHHQGAGRAVKSTVAGGPGEHSNPGVPEPTKSTRLGALARGHERVPAVRHSTTQYHKIPE